MMTDKILYNIDLAYSGLLKAVEIKLTIYSVITNVMVLYFYR